MKKRGVISVLTLAFVILGFLAACIDPNDSGTNSSNSTQTGTTDPGSNPNDPGQSGPAGPGSTQPASNYTVTFNANGGSPAPNPQSISTGGKIAMPPAITKTGYIFGGWYKESACTNQWDFAINTVSGNITLYAGWYSPTTVSGTSLAAKLQWLSTNAASNSGYILEVTDAFEELAGQNLFYNGKNNITIQLKGIESSRVIASSSGFLFSIQNGVTLILDENLILRDAVQVRSSGKLIMNQGVKINNGVYNDGGTFTMNGGEITSGVDINRGTFTMNGGKISGNPSGRGVGVYMWSATFTMSGGEISGSTSGGGVYVEGASFTMSGGKISGNTSGRGGGVYVGGSSATGSSATFTMSGGEISDNTSFSGGGGVYVSGGTFTMSGGEISDNTSSSGGGVYVSGNNVSLFDKTGGTIYGYTIGNSKSNVVKNNSGGISDNRGHAVYVDNNTNSYIKRKETTAGPTVNLSYIGRLSPPVWAGAWDY